MVTSRIDSKHHGRCDSPVAPREKATDPYVNLTGSQTLLFQLERQRTCKPPHETWPDSPMKTTRKQQDPCRHWRGTTRCWPQLQIRTLSTVATAEESRETPRNSHGDWTFLRPPEWVPEVPIVTREEPQVCCHNSRKTRRFFPQREMRPFSTVVSGEKSHFPS